MTDPAAADDATPAPLVAPVPEWTSPDRVVVALGPTAGAATDDAYLIDCCAAANAWAWRKRDEAGYDDPETGPAPSPDVAMGTTLYAVALWRERASTDGYNSFEDLGAFPGTVGGSSAQINRLLGVPRAASDASSLELTEATPHVRRRLRYRGRW